MTCVCGRWPVAGALKIDYGGARFFPPRSSVSGTRSDVLAKGIRYTNTLLRNEYVREGTTSGEGRMVVGGGGGGPEGGRPGTRWTIEEVRCCDERVEERGEERGKEGGGGGRRGAPLHASGWVCEYVRVCVRLAWVVAVSQFGCGSPVGRRQRPLRGG